jgi:hypothetical protein
VRTAPPVDRARLIFPRFQAESSLPRREAFGLAVPVSRKVVSGYLVLGHLRFFSSLASIAARGRPVLSVVSLEGFL